MKATVTPLENARVKIACELDAETVDKKIASTYKEFAKKYNFPGFRKGKAPRAVVDNALGREAVMATVTEDLINDAYPQIIENERIYPSGSPDFGDPGMAEAGKPFSFELELNVRPEVELTSYDPVEIEVPVSEATQTEIDGQINTILEHYQEEELTDEFAKDKMGFNNAEELKEHVAKSITDQKQSVMPRIKENACGLKLAERVDAEVPEAMAEATEAELLQDFFTQLQQAGMTFDAYLEEAGIDNDQFKADVKRQAEDEAKQQLALDAWARHKGIEATDEDVTNEFVTSGVANPKQLQEKWRNEGRLYLIREGITRAKAMRDVIDTAIVKEVDFAAKEAEEKSENEK